MITFAGLQYIQSRFLLKKSLKLLLFSTEQQGFIQRKTTQKTHAWKQGHSSKKAAVAPGRLVRRAMCVWRGRGGVEKECCPQPFGRQCANWECSKA